MRIISWVKSNKLSSILILIIGFFIVKNGLSSLFGRSSYQMMPSSSYDYATESMGSSVSNMKLSLPRGGGGSDYYPGNPAPPAPDIKDRMVVQNSYLSLVVIKVADALQEIKSYTSSIGGYMVNSNISNPEENSNGNITLRIPSNRLDEVLAKFRGLAVKVASERLDGTDVTDQFVDNEARLSVLNSNMARFKEIMGQAKEVSDILRVQQEVFNLQSQIDSIKGQNKYMEQTSKMALVTIYLSTDEYTLPYAPSQPWRPDVIFKTAVRSLIGNLRGLASTVIWIVVYSVFWLPVVLVIIYLRKKRKVTG
jgi:hypothetical protein